MNSYPTTMPNILLTDIITRSADLAAGSFILLLFLVFNNYLLFCLIITYVGRKSTIGKGWVFLLSFLLTPVAGLIAIVVSGERVSSYERTARLQQLREQGILSEEEFTWKYKPVTSKELMRELADLRDEGILSSKEYQIKIKQAARQHQYFSD